LRSSRHLPDNQNVIEKTYLKEAFSMKVWVCTVCGWIYDEAKGDPDYDLAPGVPFEDLPDDFVCPLCGVGKDMFEEQQS
jgi:rubredoxin